MSMSRQQFSIEWWGGGGGALNHLPLLLTGEVKPHKSLWLGGQQTCQQILLLAANFLAANLLANIC